MTLPYEYVDAKLHERRERVFLVLAGVFIGAMAMLNIIGITRIIEIGPLTLAVGVLPYPLTFVCTDLISELYGRRRANHVVLVGFFVNVLVIATMWLGHMLPAAAEQPPWQTLELAQAIGTPDGGTLAGRVELFELMYVLSASAMLASMLAYVAAQFCDVYMFHFWKRVTRGKYLWLRNNGSTLVSQLVDATIVTFVTFGAAYFAGEQSLQFLLTFWFSNYAFKFLAALADTLPLYLLVNWLSRYLRIDPRREHRGWDESDAGATRFSA